MKKRILVAVLLIILVASLIAPAVTTAAWEQGCLRAARAHLSSWEGIWRTALIGAAYPAWVYATCYSPY